MVFRRFVKAPGLFPPKPRLAPFRIVLCIALESGGGCGGFLLQLVRPLVGSESRTSCEGHTQCQQAGVKLERHATVMRLAGRWLAWFGWGIRFQSAVSLGVRVRPVRSEQR